MYNSIFGLPIVKHKHNEKLLYYVSLADSGEFLDFEYVMNIVNKNNELKKLSETNGFYITRNKDENMIFINIIDEKHMCFIVKTIIDNKKDILKITNMEYDADIMVYVDTNILDIGCDYPIEDFYVDFILDKFNNEILDIL